MSLVKIKECVNCKIGHEWLFTTPTLKELRAIKTLTGLNGIAFSDAASDSDPEAIAALLYILHKRDKITVPFEEIDLDFDDFEMIETDAERAEREAAEAAEKGKSRKAEDPEWPSAKGGLTAQVSSYAADLWECFGLNPIEVWDLEASHFFALAKAMDRKRIADKKAADKDRG